MTRQLLLLLVRCLQMAPSSQNPTSWDEYDGRPSPSGSLTSSVLADEQALLDDDEDGDDGAHGDGSRLILGQERRRHVFRLVVFGTGTFG